MDNKTSLGELRADFLAGSTNAMPLAGLIAWSLLGVAALWLPPLTVGMAALYIMMLILPLAFLLDWLHGRNLFAGGTDNPLTGLFLASVGGIAVTVPLVVIGAQKSGDPTLVVLGMAVLAGVVWIPYGWAADDPVGLRHAIARALGCYAAFWFAPPAYKMTTICAVVVLAYLYSLIYMRTREAGRGETPPSAA